MHRAQTCENGALNSSEADLRSVCNLVEILEKRDKFSKRLLRKVKNKRIYHQWNRYIKLRLSGKYSCVQALVLRAKS